VNDRACRGMPRNWSARYSACGMDRRHGRFESKSWTTANIWCCSHRAGRSC